MADDKPIIIIKKKGGHGGHHGGAWKIAYADFVTAMMCFFMVMWLVNSASTPTKQSIATYFRRPGIFDSGSGTPLLLGNSGILTDAAPPVGEDKGKKSPAVHDSSQYKKKSGTDDSQSDRRITFRGENNTDKPLPEVSEISGLTTKDPGETLSRIDKKKILDEIAEQIREKVMGTPELAELLGIVDVKVEADGLNIEIMDTEKTSMFLSGSARIQPEAEAAFAKITGILAKLNNKIDIIGHTDAKPFASRTGGYTNWELSADRANAARRVLEESGIPADHISSVIGQADRTPRTPNDPLAASNRRITLKMQFDFTKNIDLAKDPEGLDKIPLYEKEHQEAIKKSEEERKAAREKVHSLTPKEILEANKNKKSVTLPSDYQKREENLSSSKDKIFGDSPVIGQPDFIYGE